MDSGVTAFTRRQQVAYGLFTLALAIILSSGFAAWYSAKVSGEAREAARIAAAEYTDRQNRYWCVVLGILTKVDPRTLPAPTTAAGRESRPDQIASYDSFVRMRTTFHCDDLNRARGTIGQ